MAYIRAYVTPIRMHFDPVALITVKKEVVVAYGLAPSDLLRMKSSLDSLSQHGLLLVGTKDDHYRFLVFDEVVVCVFPGFKEAADEIALPCSYDFQLNDISKGAALYSLSRWVTLRESKRLEAEKRSEQMSSKIHNSRVEKILGSEALQVVQDLMHVGHAFRPLHAMVLLAKADLRSEIPLAEKNLSAIKAGLNYIPGSTNRLLIRKKPKITLMDCAEFLFKRDKYFEIETAELSEVLGLHISKVPSHLRGYLIVEDSYVDRLRSRSKQE